MFKITVSTTKQVKKSGTKTVWEIAEQFETIFNRKEYDNCTNKDTVSFFRRFGGTETVTKNYTCMGYVVTKIVSTSPDKQSRTIREFTFDSVNFDYLVHALRKLQFEYDSIDIITNRLMKDSGNRENEILNNYDAVEVDGNILSIIGKDNNSFNIDLRIETMGNLC